MGGEKKEEAVPDDSRGCKKHRGRELGATVHLSITVYTEAAAYYTHAHLKISMYSLPLFEFLKRYIQCPHKNLKTYPKNQISPNSAFTDFNRSCSSVFDDSAVLPSTHIFPKPHFCINHSHDYKCKKVPNKTTNQNKKETPKSISLKSNYFN